MHPEISTTGDPGPRRPLAQVPSKVARQGPEQAVKDRWKQGADNIEGWAKGGKEKRQEIGGPHHQQRLTRLHQVDRATRKQNVRTCGGVGACRNASRWPLAFWLLSTVRRNVDRSQT